jgi:arylsulfatase A-like enzyme
LKHSKWGEQPTTFFVWVALSLLLLITLMSMQAPLPKIKLIAHANSPRPNIVLILTDDETLESVAKMPYLSSRTDWSTFDNAFENVSLCCPSRASILTGQYDTHTGVLDNTGAHDGRKLNEANTLPVWLHRVGYRTALIGKYLNGYPWTRGNYIPPGWDDWHAFLTPPGVNYFGYKLNENGVVHSYDAATADYSTDVLASKAVNFVQSAPTPFFLYFAPHAPHPPFIPAPRHAGVYATAPVRHSPNFNEADVSDKPAFIRRLGLRDAARMDRDRRHQWEMMLAVDEGIKKIDAALAARGQLGNTVEIFLTDNGFAHGEHRWEAKRCEYDVCMHSPLMIRYPGQPARHIPDLAQNIDMAATIADIAGAIPGLAQDGISLVPLIKGTATSRRTELLEHWGGGGTVGLGTPPNFWAIRTRRYLYVELVTGEKELYDYTVDPFELGNKAGKSAYASVQRDLAMRLAALKMKAMSPPR